MGRQRQQREGRYLGGVEAGSGWGPAGGAMGVLRPGEGAGLPAWAGLGYGANVDRAGCVGP